MARTYAAVLGLLAAGMMITRSAINGGGLEETIWTASVAAFIFAAIGFAAGFIGEMLVKDSVQAQFRSAMSEWEAKQSGNNKKPAAGSSRPSASTATS